MSKAIVIGYLAKVSAANVNASHTEGNVVVAKKLTTLRERRISYWDRMTRADRPDERLRLYLSRAGCQMD